MDAEDPNALLQARLDRGHERVDSATPGSPEWDAALANTDALEHQIDALRPLASAGGEHVVSRLGPVVLEDGCVVHGMIAALGTDGEALRVDVSGVPDSVRTRAEFIGAIKALVHRARFILEIESGERELNFYAWDPELREPEPLASPGSEARSGR